MSTPQSFSFGCFLLPCPHRKGFSSWHVHYFIFIYFFTKKRIKLKHLFCQRDLIASPKDAMHRQITKRPYLKETGKKTTFTLNEYILYMHEHVPVTEICAHYARVHTDDSEQQRSRCCVWVTSSTVPRCIRCFMEPTAESSGSWLHKTGVSLWTGPWRDSMIGEILVPGSSSPVTERPAGDIGCCYTKGH